VLHKNTEKGSQPNCWFLFCFCGNKKRLREYPNMPEVSNKKLGTSGPMMGREGRGARAPLEMP
jgi:hypothetical protein